MISASKCRPLNSAGCLRRMHVKAYQTRPNTLQHIHIECVSARQLRERFGQVNGTRHSRATNENRNDANSTLERRSDFYSHEVFGRVQPTAATFISSLEPLLTNYRE